MVYGNIYKNFQITNINKKWPLARQKQQQKMKSTPILLIHSNAWGHNLKEIKITFPINSLLQKFYSSDSSADRLHDGLG